MTQPVGKSAKRALVASVLGTSIEFYDFYIYGTAASLVFGPLFFPSSSPTAQLMFSYATFSVAFIARPLGAITLGHFGDRIGRKAVFIASMLLMSFSTVAIGFLPTYASIGWLAPFFLSALRFGQGFGLGGVWSSAALLATESAPAARRGLYGMVPNLGYTLGFIAANGIFLILGAALTPNEFQQWGWRIPFLASVVLIGLGVWARWNLEEAADYTAAVKKEPPPLVPVKDVLRAYPRQTVTATFALTGQSVGFYISMVFLLGYGTGVLKIDRQDLLALLLLTIPLHGVGVIVAGYLGDRFTLSRLLMAANFALALGGLLLVPLVGDGSTLKIGLYFAITFFLNGTASGPLPAMMTQLFPARVRFTGSALGYNLGNILGGGFAPMIATSLMQIGGLAYVGYYLAAAAFASVLGFTLVRNK